MSSRKPGYVFGVCLLAFFFSLPGILVALQATVVVYRTQSLAALAFRFHCLTGSGHGNSILATSEFWQDKFVYCSGEFFSFGDGQPVIHQIDPETGESTTLKLKLKPRNFHQPKAYGERLWWMAGDESFEVIDGVAQRSSLVSSWKQDVGRNFLWNGLPSHVEHERLGLCASFFVDDEWRKVGRFILPESPRSVGSVNPIGAYRGEGFDVRMLGDQIHLFLQLNGDIYHREGLGFDPNMSNEENVIFNQFLAEIRGPISALKPSNTPAALAGWTLARLRPSEVSRDSVVATFAPPPSVLGMFVEGQPAMMVFDVDQINSNVPVGDCYRLKDSKWDKFASFEFPFGSHGFRTFNTRDGNRSYVLASTSTGGANVFAVEATGIRKTHGADYVRHPIVDELFFKVILPAVALVCGILFALATWFLMWCYTKPEYGFGIHSVKLASLGWRGLARLIDIGLIFGSTLALGKVLTIGFDLSSLGEAINLKVDHPSIPVAVRIMAVVVTWLIGSCLAYIITQAKWGITPGKWLCGLRTLRTSLRPIGFARSLAREIGFFFDCSNFYCWSPGILSIAFTDRRQRLGDLIADTIVVESRSFDRSGDHCDKDARRANSLI